ncbi:LacI family DNA-binding transcriptional regulator [Kordiimonas gwangyangensis]|uniref:LacI family DNA-binding transcriptional regulator n=1 Tax=Kordiimonas gwangyangensis TaxID=288022 RepID=UPI00036FDB32|nr:LacI family DNA-binding transcriptional regulator [Kordiimonas gwangyangensis]
MKTKLTINDIARLANVSKKTVSRVINDSPRVRAETRDRIKAIIAEHDFSPDLQARALAFRRSFLVAMIYDNPSPQYVVNMQRGILDTLEDTAYQLVVRPCDRNAPRFYEAMQAFLEQQRLFGAILPPSVSEDEKVAELLRAANCPYVRIASVVLDEPDRMIWTHDAEGAAQAARHIAKLGHTRIAHIRGLETFRSSHERLRGFKSGLAEHGLDLPDDMVIEGGYTFDSGVECARILLSRTDRPTAIFAGNDEMALGVYQVAREMKLRVPYDVSIVGFDDTPIASRVSPTLTTVKLPIREMGKSAAAMLLAPADAPKRTEPISFMPEIVVRESTAKPAK